MKVIYLHKQLYDHMLLQAIARVNRPYKEKKFGLIVDFAGVIEYAKEAIKNYELLDKDTFKQLEFAVSKLEEAFEEFKYLISEVKEELKSLKIGNYEISLNIEELLNDSDYYSKLDSASKILALGFVSSDPNAVGMLNMIRRIVQLYMALGSYPKKLDYYGDVVVLSKLYNAIMNRVKGRRLPRQFWDDLIELIHDKTTIPELDVIREETFTIEDFEKVLTKIELGKISVDTASEVILTFRSFT